MNKNPQLDRLVIRRIVAFLGLCLVILGQYFTFTTVPINSELPPASSLLTVPGIILILVSFWIPVGVNQSRENTRIPGRTWATVSIVFAALTLFALILFMKHDQTNYLPVLFTWFATGAFYVAAFCPDLFASIRWREWFKDHRREFLIVGAITLLAAALRFYSLGGYPRILDGDEGLMGLTAQTSNILPYSNPYSLWENFGALFLQLINLCFRFFGVSAFSLRLLPAISGVLAIPAVYLFSRQITNKRVATIAAILLAISHTHIHFSRIVSVGYIHSTWLAPLELYLLLSGLEKKSSWRTALAGVLLAVHFSVYLTSQIITALILVFMVICIIFLRKSFMQVLRQAGAFWGGFFLMILPELYYITQNPNQFFDRLNQDGLMTNGWLAQTVASTGQSTIEILANRVIHAFLSLIYYPAVDFYGSSVPMLTLIGAVLFLIGLGIALIRARTYGYLLLNGYFWAATLAVGIFAVPPSADSYRMLIALPPAIIMAALALDEIVSLFGISWERSRRSYVFIASIVLIGLFGYNFWAYYIDFVGQCRYGGGIVGRFASYVGDFVSDQVNPNDTVYLLSDDIYFHGSHASTDFLSNSRPIINYSDPISTLQVYSGDVIIANPDRFSELEDWSHTIPGSELIHIYDCRSLILLAYQVP